MPSNSLWEQICFSARRISDAGKGVWSGLTDLHQSTSTPELPDALALEDRVLFNAAPVDLVGVDIQIQVGGDAEGGASGTAVNPGTTDPGGSASPPTPPAAPELLADDQYISVNPEDRFIATYDFGGGNNPDGRNISMGIDKTGWEVFLRDHLEPVLEAGVKRFELHTPFGQRSLIIDPVTGAVSRPADQWGFQFDAWLDAQVETPKVTDDFVSAFQDFFAKYEGTGELEDMVIYLGSPRLDPDQTALESNPAAWWDRAYDIMEPVLQAGFRSVAFDASSPATPDTLDYQLHDVLRYPELRDPVRDARLIEIVGNERVEVYLEAVPTRDTGRTDFPLMILDNDYRHQDPERVGAHSAFRRATFPEHDQFTGEIVRMVRHEQWKAEGHLPAERILLEGDSVGVTPTYFLRPSLGGAETLEDYLAKMDLPSLPTDVDLDPDDLNPQTATYTITVGPKHGTLTPNRFHDDVFTYTPDAYYTGTDSFEYVVRDASGAKATAVVSFFVNTEVVMPPEVPAPSEPPPAAPPDPPVPTELPPSAPPPLAPPAPTPAEPPADSEPPVSLPPGPHVPPPADPGVSQGPATNPDVPSPPVLGGGSPPADPSGDGDPTGEDAGGPRVPRSADDGGDTQQDPTAGSSPPPAETPAPPPAPAPPPPASGPTDGAGPASPPDSSPPATPPQAAPPSAPPPASPAPAAPLEPPATKPPQLPLASGPSRQPNPAAPPVVPPADSSDTSTPPSGSSGIPSPASPAAPTTGGDEANGASPPGGDVEVRRDEDASVGQFSTLNRVQLMAADRLGSSPGDFVAPVPTPDAARFHFMPPSQPLINSERAQPPTTTSSSGRPPSIMDDVDESRSPGSTARGPQSPNVLQFLTSPLNNPIRRR